MMRRIGALVLLVALGGLIAKVGGALFGADDTEAGGVDPAETTVGSSPIELLDDAGTTIAGGSVEPGDTAGTQVPGDTTPATVDTSPHVPTAAEPAVVLIAGDSDAGTFGPYLDTLLDDTGVVQTTLDYKVSTGLARPDQVDWPARFRQIIPEIDPDIVVVTFGGNDAQGLSEVGGNFVVMQPTGEPGGDQEWRAEYGKRVGEVMDYLSSEGRTLVWVGIPNDDNPDVTARMKVQDEVVRAEVAKRPQVMFVDTWKRFSGRDGNWAEYVIDPRDGQGKDVRADDGFHLNVAGAEILALDIAEIVRQELVNRGAAI
ncbi:MAG: GDSL-type esterase/lipase family protein [Ilumatobacteraceae bacterium]